MNVPTDIKNAIAAAHGAPIDLVDGEKHYVIIPADVYERLKEIAAADDWDPAEMRRSMAKVMEEDWTDPQMDSYDTRQ